MDFKISHFGVLVESMEKSLDFYQKQMGSQLTIRHHQPGVVDIAFLGKGNDTMVELVAAPFLPYEQDHLSRHGYSINHISFLVDDADHAFELLKGSGVKVAWAPKDYEFLRQCGFYDNNGLLFEIYSHLGETSIPVPDLNKPIGRNDLILQHISILTEDLAASERFYIEHLGLRRAVEYTNPSGGGFVFLVDPFYDGKKHGFLLEIIGPPELEEREEDILKAHGPFFDHICYEARSVSGAFQEAVDKGAKKFMTPYEGFGAQIAWLKDMDGNDVEILDPFAKEYIGQIVREKRAVVIND